MATENWYQKCRLDLGSQVYKSHFEDHFALRAYGTILPQTPVRSCNELKTVPSSGDAPARERISAQRKPPPKAAEGGLRWALIRPTRASGRSASFPTAYGPRHG